MELRAAAPRLLQLIRPDRHRDPAELAQRNALLSFSKNPFVGPVGLLAGRTVELLEQVALLLGQLPWDGDVDEHPLVAATESLQDGHPAAAQDDHLAGLRPWIELELRLTVQGRIVRRAPGAACVIVGSTVEKMSSPSRTKRSSGRTRTRT